MAAFNPIGRHGGRGGRGSGGQEDRVMVVDSVPRLFIKGIPDIAIVEHGPNALRAEFEKFGPIEKYVLMVDKSGRFTGNALCTYRNPADAKIAVRELDKQVFGDSLLEICFARTRDYLFPEEPELPSEPASKWKHDRFEAIQRPPYRGRSGRGRGRGNRRMNADEYNQQLRERLDEELDKLASTREAEGTAQKEGE